MDPEFLLSPSETKPKKVFGDLAIYSPIPEKRGADLLFSTRHGLFGIQRKQVPHDFLSSVIDGRFAQSLPLLRKLSMRAVIGEGVWQYRANDSVYVRGERGVSLKAYERFTRRSVKSLEWDIELVHDVPLMYVADTEEYVDYVVRLKEYINKQDHLGLYRRPGLAGAWGIPTQNEKWLWILQGFSGIGVKTAEKMIECCGGVIPLRWVFSKEDLGKISGISKPKAEDLWNTLPASDYRVS